MRRRYWLPSEDAELIRRYPHESTKDLANSLGRSRAATYQRARTLGLHKTAAYLRTEQSGRLTGKTKGSRFAKGHKTWNAGRKGWQAGGRSVQTQFKKGRPPSTARNYQPIGTERISKDGYVERKVTDSHPTPARRWVGVHRLVWITAHGPVPRGCIVVFKPGAHTTDADGITADKLECITRAENMKRNSYHNYPQPIPQLIQLRGALMRKINRSASA